MRRALLIAALIALAAVAANADIRRLMQAKGYAPAQGGQCEGTCGGFVSSQDAVTDTPSFGTDCTFPATFPCTFGG